MSSVTPAYAFNTHCRPFPLRFLPLLRPRGHCSHPILLLPSSLLISTLYWASTKLARFTLFPDKMADAITVADPEPATATANAQPDGTMVQTDGIGTEPDGTTDQADGKITAQPALSALPAQPDEPDESDEPGSAIIIPHEGFRTKMKSRIAKFNTRMKIRRGAGPENQFIQCEAFNNVQTAVRLNAADIGPTGSDLQRRNTTLAENGQGRLPYMVWTQPNIDGLDYWALICEDLDASCRKEMHHGIFFNIPSARCTATQSDIKEQEGPNTPRLTASAWNYITTRSGNSSYVVPTPPRSGAHRYVFTIVALNRRFNFDTRNAHKLTKGQFQQEIRGHVLAYGQWEGVYKRFRHVPIALTLNPM